MHDNSYFCRTLLVLLALLACGNQLTAKVVTSRLIDVNKQPIQGVTVSDGHKAVYSLTDGSFALETSADSLYLSRIGYLSQSVPVKELPNPIIMLSSEILLPTIRVTAVEYRSSTPALDSHFIYPDTNGGQPSTNEMLLSNTSFSSTDTQLSGERQTVSLLGSFSRHTLVQLDGIPLNSAGEAFDFSTIPVSQISSIEVIKGSSSVYGGSAAIGGIINIHTKNASKQKHLELGQSTGIGSFGMLKQQYSAAYTLGLWSVSTEYAHYDAQNNFKYDTPDWWGIEPTLVRSHNRKLSDAVYLKARGGYKNYLIEGTLNYSSFVRQLPGPINFLELYDNSRLYGHNQYQNLKVSASSGKLTNELSLWENFISSYYNNYRSSNNAATNAYSQDQNSYGLKYLALMHMKDSRLDFSAEYGRQSYVYDSGWNLARGVRDNTGLMLRAEHKQHFPYLDYSLTGAGRLDIDSAATHKTWRLEQLITIPWATELKLGNTLGTAYSLPSFFDMYWIGDSETQGNPNLTSESSFGTSFWANLSHPFYELKAAYYYNEIENLIQWRHTYLYGSTWKPINIGTAEISNWEFEANLKPYKYISITGGFTFTEARDMSQTASGLPTSTYNKYLTYTPKQRIQAKLIVADETKGLHLGYSYSGEQYSTPDNLIDPLPAVGLFDAGSFYKLSYRKCDLVLDIKLNNLLDKRYQVYAYVPQPGFNWSLCSSLSLKL
jgi:outer membrane cobalamin receptor